MRYGTVCSGIEGSSVAWLPLGWQPAWFAEVDGFCCRLLSERYPTVTNLGDITKDITFPAVDLLAGGTPCQSFSIQGLRGGLDDARGNLMLRFCQIASVIHPRWLLWENVPGVLSSNRGRDFGTLIGALVELGYGVAWRVLDALCFGVPQRRKRVYVVGHYGDWRRAASVVFDGPSRTANVGEVEEVQVSQQRIGVASGEPIIGWTGDETPKHGIECTPTLRAFQGGEGVGVIGRGLFRRLTVTEWERLQGFPDGYTDIGESSVRPRITALGNAFCVPVLRWIAERIQFLEEIRHGVA